MIMLRLMGGLGNQMFQYAAGRALASRWETELKLDLSLLLDRTPLENRVFREYELEDFTIKAALATSHEIARFHPPRTSLLEKVQAKLSTLIAPPNVYLEPTIGYDPELLQLADETCLVGNFQSPRYFEGIETELREEFSFHLPENDHIQTILRKIQASPNSIALHVRRGDYVSNSHFSKVLGSQPMSYYRKGVALLLEKLGDISLWVFSDDIAWCRKELEVGHPFELVEYPVKLDKAHKYDMQLMSSCNHFLISNSTFSWWGAWKGNHPQKIVIAPKVWYQAKDRDNQHITPADWIRL